MGGSLSLFIFCMHFPLILIFTVSSPFLSHIDSCTFFFSNHSCMIMYISSRLIYSIYHFFLSSLPHFSTSSLPPLSSIPPTAVSIQSTACLKDYDQSGTLGPSWYRIEALYDDEEDSEREALGSFTIAENMEEASHCSKVSYHKSIFFINFVDQRMSDLY